MSLLSIRRNPLLLTDAYNLSHQRLKINTDWEVSHIYNRTNGMVLYGFAENIANIFNRVIEPWMIDEAVSLSTKMNLRFPADLFRDLIERTGGVIPLKIEALPDGSWVPAGSPFAQVRNTCKGFGELVTWWEGLMLHSYFPSGCATNAFRMRRYLLEKQRQYSFDDSFLWRFHSFGFRGHRSLEDAYWCGSAWNLFLHGTDDFHTILHTPNAVIGSIAALAHKVTQQYDNEWDCYAHAIDSTASANEKVVAIVIDTYDATNFMNRYLIPIARRAASRGIKVVFRPDSGDVCKQAIEIYQRLARLNLLGATAVIIGDDMSFERAIDYDYIFERAGVPLNFINYGIGAGFYKHIERDTLGWAMKTAYSNGKPRMKFSNTSIKQSLPGVVKMVRVGNRNQVLVAALEDEYPGLSSEYKILYNVTNLRSNGAVVYDWDRTYAKVQTLPQDEIINQDVVVLSNGIQHLIRKFKEEYDHGMAKQCDPEGPQD